MINKKQFLGHKPVELGQKDAVHVAIVSVRAAQYIQPGQRCKLNEFGEAIPGNGPGIADPFVKEINRGEYFWLILNSTEVENVSHTWEHPSITFEKPKREAQYNKYLEGYAEDLGVTYKELMSACNNMVYNDKRTAYPGSLNEEELESIQDDIYDIWCEWAEETGHEFENYGTACCPEHEYPEGEIFYINREEIAGD